MTTPAPCAACPFRRARCYEQPASAAAHAAAVEAGAWACCHVTMGSCIGAAQYRANLQRPGAFPAVVDRRPEFLAPPAVAVARP